MAIEVMGGTAARPGLPGVIVAATIGNVLEWFDFLVYGFFAVYMSEVFFPTNDPNVSLLITFGTFGLAYGAPSSSAATPTAPAARRASHSRSAS